MNIFSPITNQNSPFLTGVKSRWGSGLQGEAEKSIMAAF